MSIKNKLLEKCTMMQWGIGFAKGNIEDIIRNKKLDLDFTWLPQRDKWHFIADPFIFRNKQGNINVLYEDFSLDTNGFVSVMTIDEKFGPVFQKQLLKTSSHLSYPYIFKENGITYIIPESYQRGIVAIYEYDLDNNVLINEKTLIDLPLVDSTILKYNDKYWLFATMGDGEFDNSKLYISYADSLLGEYKPHAQNPVRHNLDATRPAGGFIIVDGNVYRPSQNCSEYYGKSITINKVLTLSETAFEEEYYWEITPGKNSLFNAGLHTINGIDDVVVIDGKRLRFIPITKTRAFLKKTFSRQRKVSKNNFPGKYFSSSDDAV